MSQVTSCGIVPIRKFNDKYEILLCLPSECAFRANQDPNVFQGMGFLKGQVENDETNLQTAIREFGEESGYLDVELFGEDVYFTQNNPMKLIHIWPSKLSPTLDNEYRIKDGVVVEHDTENALIKFFPIDELPAVFRNQQKILRELIDFIEKNEINM